MRQVEAANREIIICATEYVNQHKNVYIQNCTLQSHENSYLLQSYIQYSSRYNISVYYVYVKLKVKGIIENRCPALIIMIIYITVYLTVLLTTNDSLLSRQYSLLDSFSWSMVLRRKHHLGSMIGPDSVAWQQPGSLL